jgi:peptidoglycan/xylan/chitin deacetylase (PgdA/CDA1 family)|tara:strand:+ start:4728 stop:5708 length:981 start_codon:yes stop_codon:yes gene_type:complete
MLPMKIKPLLAKLATSVLRSKLNPDNNIGVLYFHRVLKQKDSFFPDDFTEVEFSALLDVLKSSFELCSISEGLVKSESASEKPILCISFDDGYLDNFSNALPILQEKGVKATFFVATSGVERGYLDQDVVENWFRNVDAKLIPLAIRNVPGGPDLGEFPDRAKAYQTYLNYFKYLSPEYQAEIAMARLAQIHPLTAFEDCMMKPEHVKRLVELGHEVGGHTHSHRILTTVDDNEALDEISSCKEKLEDWTEGSVSLFAYPNGNPEKDFTEAHINMVQQCGFDFAFSTKDGGVKSGQSENPGARFLPYRREPVQFALSSLKIMGETA